MGERGSSSAVHNRHLIRRVQEVAELCQPESIHRCNGAREEYDLLMRQTVERGMAILLKKRPNTFLFRSHTSDVVRVEDRTFINTTSRDDADPTNNWIAPDELKSTTPGSYQGCMRDRTMYIVPFSMDLLNSPFARFGMETTDSPYIVCNMHIMTRVGNKVLDTLGSNENFAYCLHSMGVSLSSSQKDTTWPCTPVEQKYISHFPKENLVWFYSSGYGGNTLLGKKHLAPCIASFMAREERWMAEHMLILRLISPEGRRYHIIAAFPSACDKTNLAMIQPTTPGWKAECLGDDIAWMRIGPDGRLHASIRKRVFWGCTGNFMENQSGHDEDPLGKRYFHKLRSNR